MQQCKIYYVIRKWEKQILNRSLLLLVTMTEDELTTLLVISSIHMLKRNKKKCGRLEVYNLVKESVKFEISSNAFTEASNCLIENESVIVNTFRNRECISLPKGNF